MKCKIFLFLIFLLSACNYQDDPYERFYDAIRKNDIDRVNKIIDSGIDLNPDGSLWTPLMIATLRSNYQIIDLLLKKGADINKRNRKGQTVLHIAARWKDGDLVRYLIERGADVNVRDYLSWSPLMWASLRGNDSAVDVLIKSGADVNFRDIDKNTPLILAAWHGHKKTILILLSNNADRKAKNVEGLNACDVARNKGFNEIVSILKECK